MKANINIFLLIASFFSSSLIAQDWPNLARYQKANAELETPSKDNRRVVFMGDSITEGWANDSTSFFQNPSYIGRGISGQTTPQMLIRFSQDVIKLQPRVVVLLAGINDIAHNTGPSTVEMIADNLMSMAEIAYANNIKVIISSVLPADDFPWRKGMNPGPKVIALNKIMKAYAHSHGHIYLDYFTPMANKKNGMDKDLASDGVHPTKKGYLMMEKLCQAAIDKAFEMD